MSFEASTLIRHDAGAKIVGMSEAGVIFAIEVKGEDTDWRVERASLDEVETLFKGDKGECGDVLDALASRVGGRKAPTPVVDATGADDAERGATLKKVAQAACLGAALIGGAYAGITWQKTASTPVSVTSAPDVIPGGPVAPVVAAASTPKPIAPVVLAPASVAPLPAQPNVDLPTPTGTDAVALAQAVAAIAPKPNETVTAPSTGEAPGAQAVVAPPIDLSTIEGRSAAAGAQLKTSSEKVKAEIAGKGAGEVESDINRMKAAVAALMSGEKISPEIARQLPVEIAKKMQDAGAILSAEDAQLIAGKPTFVTVKLPAAVVDRFRDADGVSTIPDQNSWAATKGNVVLPMPGGGDIVKISDFAAFSLEH